MIFKQIVLELVVGSDVVDVVLLVVDASLVVEVVEEVVLELVVGSDVVDVVETSY